jgi:hypothetical protein
VCGLKCRGVMAQKGRMATGNAGRKPSHGACVGGRLTPLYRRWSGMIARCHAPSHSAYPRYGGCGIHVCEEWRASFAAFRDWSTANGFSPELQIDRINNVLGYSPENCRWVTGAKNQANRRDSITFPSGETTAEVAQRLGMSHNAVLERLYTGLTKEQAMTIPRTPNGAARRYFRKKLSLWQPQPAR